MTVDRAEVVSIVEAHYSSREMRAILERIADDAQALLTFMGRFFQYAAAFSVGQAALASQVAARKDLFKVSGEVGVFADASMSVGRGIFFGAIDEFGDREIGGQHTHRALALATLKGMAAHFDYDLSRLSDRVLSHAPTTEAIAKVSRYYGVNVAIDEARLFRGIGFHLGTEVLGEDENRVFDAFFSSRLPALMASLGRATVRLNNVAVPADVWFKRHIVAEADHFAAGIDSANLAFEHYSGRSSRTQLRHWVAEGIQAVASVQRDVMRTILVD